MKILFYLTLTLLTMSCSKQIDLQPSTNTTVKVDSCITITTTDTIFIQNP